MFPVVAPRLPAPPCNIQEGGIPGRDQLMLFNPRLHVFKSLCETSIRVHPRAFPEILQSSLTPLGPLPTCGDSLQGLASCLACSSGFHLSVFFIGVGLESIVHSQSAG